MLFSPTQLHALGAPLSRDAVKTREQSGRTLSFVEGWHVIAEANRIFGFDGWSSETIELRCVAEGERVIGRPPHTRPGHGVTYTAKVRITVLSELTREGTGAGHGIDSDLGQAHESAIKEAETDARKRALMTFGNPFGLALYDKAQANVADEAELSRLRFIEATKAKIASFADGDRDGVARWWQSDEQHKARRDFGVTPAELIELKSLMSLKVKPPPPGEHP
jgi:hypothetical protein